MTRISRVDTMLDKHRQELVKDILNLLSNERHVGELAYRQRVNNELPWCIIKRDIKLPIARFKCERQALLYWDLVPCEAKESLKLVHIDELEIVT